MASDTHAFLRDLLSIPGPSAFEVAPARRWRAEAAGIVPGVRADVAGNSYATLEGSGGPSIMLAGHIDEIGLIVSHVDEQGFLSFEGIGGWDPQVFVGQRVTILGREGEVTGVVGKKAIHLMKPDEREKVSKIDDLWVDIGVTSREEAERHVRIGDAGVLATGLVQLPNGRLVSRSLDNRIGAYVVLEALRLLRGAARPAATVTAVATTREEIALGGGGARSSATDVAPHAALVVDVTHATDHPALDKRRHGDCRLGGGPVIARGASVSNVMFERLVEAAEAEQIPYMIQAAARDTHTDAEAIFNAHRGVATGLVSVPLRYMHSPNEMVSLDDIDRAAALLAAFCRRVEKDADFIPR
jgi:endoglucanase